jgi:predicted RNA-binding Zn ribbon-like protein
MVTAQIASVERSEPDYRFDFCGGHVAVDFTNTSDVFRPRPGLEGSRGDQPEEHFKTFGDIVAWAEAAHVMNRQAAARLRAEAQKDPESARQAFRRALELREVLYRILAARARHRMPQPADLDGFNRFVREVYAEAALAPAPDGFTLETPAVNGLDRVLSIVVRAAVALLTAPDQDRLGICAEDTCAWLFLDATRSHTRRWCDMKACGNRNKVRRFRGAT